MKEWSDLLMWIGLKPGTDVCMDGFNRAETIEGIDYIMTVFDDKDIARFNMLMVKYISMKP